MSTAESVTCAVEPLCEHGSAVRFETQCVVIPDLTHRSRRPRVVTKSYALPLWRRRSSYTGPSTASAPPEDVLSEENQSHLVLRVPVPTFSFKPRSTARSVDQTPLPPCLVHRPQPSGDTSPTIPRHARSPRAASPSPSRPDIVTVPLRPCCAACQSATDAALANGDAWPEHFSRAASRRRSMSVDSPRTITVAGSAASASYGNLGLSISVDEIDKRRRASDTGPSIANPRTWTNNDTKAIGECRIPSIGHRTTNLSTIDTRAPPSPRITPATPRIPEEDDDEDENELFPLPSPKRTPRTSPASSPAGSLSSLTVPHTNQRCTNSVTHSACSGDSHESQPGKRHFLTPPPCASSSSLSLPKLGESTTDLALTDDPPRVPSPTLLSTLPSLSGRRRSRPPSPHALPTPTDTLASATDSTPPHTPRLPERVPEPESIVTPASPGSSQKLTSPRLSPTQIRFPWRSKYSASTDVISHGPSFSPSTSPPLSSSPSMRRSIAIPDIIADVLRGVGTIGSSGMGPQL